MTRVITPADHEAIERDARLLVQEADRRGCILTVAWSWEGDGWVCGWSDEVTPDLARKLGEHTAAEIEKAEEAKRD